MLKRILIAFILMMLAFGGLNLHNRICDLDSYRHTHVSLQNLIQRVSPSVVHIKASYDGYDGWSGSGVIVGPHIVITAKHMITDMEDFTVTTVDSNSYDAVKWIVDPNNDCALLFFEEELDPIVKFADVSKLKLGDKVVMVGSPYGDTFFNTVTFGILSGLDRKVSYFGNEYTITVDAAGNPGNSGGPVFDMQGRVIGIVVGSVYGANDLSILIPSDICKRLIENARSNEKRD